MKIDVHENLIKRITPSDSQNGSAQKDHTPNVLNLIVKNGLISGNVI